MTRTRYVVVVGCGRLGSYLAGAYSVQGLSVVVIDPEPAAFLALPPEFSGFTLEGDASEIALLERAKAAKADLFVAVSEDDNVNLMAAQVAAKLFQAARVVARINDPQLADFARSLEIEVLSPAALAAERLLRHFAGEESA